METNEIQRLSQESQRKEDFFYLKHLKTCINLDMIDQTKFLKLQTDKLEYRIEKYKKKQGDVFLIRFKQGMVDYGRV